MLHHLLVLHLAVDERENRSVAADESAGGNAHGSKRLAVELIAIEQDRIGHSEFLHEPSNGGSVLALVYADQYETAGGVGAMETVEARLLGAAGGAPACPDVGEDRSPAVVGETARTTAKARDHEARLAAAVGRRCSAAAAGSRRGSAARRQGQRGSQREKTSSLHGHSLAAECGDRVEACSTGSPYQRSMLQS